MTEVLGLPLDVAVRRLTETGIAVTTVEVSSRKGSCGDDARVIKIEQTEAGATVYWARFRTVTA